MIVTCILLFQFIGAAFGQGSIVLWECNNFPAEPSPFDGCDWERTNFHHGEGNMASVEDPEGGGSDVVRLLYPEGSRAGLDGDMKGGAQFYGQPFGSHDHITFQYQVYFSENFDFVKGGKLPGYTPSRNSLIMPNGTLALFGFLPGGYPVTNALTIGLYGGEREGANACSGGGSDQHCFSTRFMWRNDGDMEIYAYIPVQEDDSFCDDQEVICDFDYGHSLGRGTFRVETGRWQTIAMDIQLNDPGQSNAAFKMFYDGEEMFSYSGLTMRRDDSMQIDQIFFSTFFGGSDDSWASTDNVYIYYKDFKILGY